MTETKTRRERDVVRNEGVPEPKLHDPRAVNPRYGAARLSDLVRAVGLPKKLRKATR